MLIKICVYVLICTIGLWSAPNASADLSPPSEPDLEILERVQFSVQDNRTQAWQLVLFQRGAERKAQDYRLRLIGFPGQVVLHHPAPLTIEDGYQHQWLAPDQTLRDSQLESVFQSVGEYDVGNIMAEIDAPERLKLSVSLAQGDQRVLIVPQHRVREWIAKSATVKR
ncbi:MAG: DUF3122 domain-containing protein [Cyanobacteria bacterium P01_F01_bin.42]